MVEQLAYVIITNESLKKSATGHIIEGLFRGLLLSPLELVAARMYAPSNKLIEEYATTMENKEFRDYLIREYIEENILPDQPTPKRAMFLLFRGENAIERIRSVVGRTSRRIDGTIRNEFADYTKEKSKVIGFTDPAVLIMPDESQAEQKLKIWAKYAESDGGLLDCIINWNSEIGTWNEDDFDKLRCEGVENVTKEYLLSKIETIMTLIKPSEDITKNDRIGGIISRFSRHGVKLIGCKVVRMSINQALDFYGHIKEKVPEEEFYNLIEYMTGKDLRRVLEPKEREELGELEHLSLALAYQGPLAISRIRKAIGATDPSKAEPGTIRSIFGIDIMKNSVHASDSQESAKKEVEIINIRETTLKEYVDNFYETHR